MLELALIVGLLAALTLPALALEDSPGRRAAERQMVSEYASERVAMALGELRAGNIASADWALTALEGLPIVRDSPSVWAFAAFVRAELEALHGRLDAAREWIAEGYRRGVAHPEIVPTLLTEALLHAADGNEAAFLHVTARLHPAAIGHNAFHLVEVLAVFVARRANPVDAGDPYRSPARHRMRHASSPLVEILLAHWPDVHAFVRLG